MARRAPGAAQDELAAAPLGARIDDDRAEDDGARNQHLPERRDIDDRQRVDDDAEEQGAEQRALHRADSAGDRDAADDASRDDGELIALRDVGIGDAVARNPKIAAEAGDRSGERMDEKLLGGKVDAAIARRDWIAADRIEPAPDAAVVEQRPEEEADQRRDHDEDGRAEQCRLGKAEE